MEFYWNPIGLDAIDNDISTSAQQSVTGAQNKDGGKRKAPEIDNKDRDIDISRTVPYSRI